MRTIGKWLFFLCILFPMALWWGEAKTDTTLVITNGMVIDGTGRPPLPKATVVISKGMIAQVGKAGDIKAPAGARVIDVRGGTILPGFVNAHVHYAYHGDNLKAWAQGGVTTVRDLSLIGDVKTILGLRDSDLKRPEYARIVSAGPMMTKPNGYGQLFVTSVEDAVKKVNQLIDDGVDLIKFSMEDGYAGTSGLPKFNEAEIHAIVSAARQRGVRVSAHITQGRYLKAVVNAGVDDVAHITYDFAPDDVVLEMIERGIIWVPTFTVYRNFGASLDVAVENLSFFVENGGKVALGNDYGGGPGHFELGIPHFEITMMKRAGMTPMQIIVACTRHAAEVCGRDNILGTLEPGKVGDLFVVRSNPLENPNALKDIQWVVKEGTIIRRP